MTRDLFGQLAPVTRAVNLRKEAYDVYIGRPGSGTAGPFGNPVKRGEVCPVCGEVHSTPGSTLPCYETYLLLRLAADEAFRQSVQSLHGKRLGCFCAPQPCHGAILADLAEQMRAENEMPFSRDEEGKILHTRADGSFVFRLKNPGVLYDRISGHVYDIGVVSKLTKRKAQIDRLRHRSHPIPDYGLDPPPDLAIEQRDDWNPERLAFMARTRRYVPPGQRRVFLVSIPSRKIEERVVFDEGGKIEAVPAVLQEWVPTRATLDEMADALRNRFVDAHVVSVLDEDAPASSPSALNQEDAVRIAIIGTAGRDKAKWPQMTYGLYVAMYQRALAEIERIADGRPIELVSGGAAWADHLAVSLLLNDKVDRLKLYLPAAWNARYQRYEETRREGGTSNYYHNLFMDQMKRSGHPHRSLSDLHKAIHDPRVMVEVPSNVTGSTFHARNIEVGKAADWILAFTWGPGDRPADGGTLHTWTKSPLPADRKIHISLASLAP